MKRLQFVVAFVLILGSIYWWQLQVTAFALPAAGDFAFSCIVTAGHGSCPLTFPPLDNYNIIASCFFYLGILFLLHLMIFPKAMHLPKLDIDKYTSRFRKK